MKKEDYTKDEIHFVVMAVEVSAKRMNISVAEMYQRLSKVNLIKELVLCLSPNEEVKHFRLVADSELFMLHSDVNSP